MTQAPTTMRDLGLLTDLDLAGLTLSSRNGVTTGNTTVTAGTIYSGSGVPSAGLGANGDFYVRTDTPATLAQRIYIRSAGSWINALA